MAFLKLLKPLLLIGYLLNMNLLKQIYRFYYEGFTNLPRWGRQVWLVILVKLFILFVVLKIFFFPNFLKTNFNTDTERSNHVLENLTNINP